MNGVKSLYQLALENIPKVPSPSEYARLCLPTCHGVYYDLFNLYYEEEREKYREDHQEKFK